MAKLDAKGISGLAFWDNGFKSFSSNRKMVKPDDMKGLKMRIQSSKVLEAQMRALGAIPQVLAFGEVYQALQTGVVDGTENPHSNLYTQKMNEVQKNITITDHGYIGYAVVVNKKFWDGLPADIRGQLTQAIADATKFTNDDALKDNEGALAKVKATGKTEILTLTKEERAVWKRALAQGAQGDGVARRHRDHPGGLQGNRLRPRQGLTTHSGDARLTAGRASGGMDARGASPLSFDDESPRSPRRVADLDPDGARDDHHLRRGHPSLPVGHADPGRCRTGC